MIRRLLGGSLAVMAVVAGCGSDDGGGGGGVGALPGNTARSPACVGFIGAECDLLADKCNKLSRPDCDDIFGGIFCKSDAAAAACTASLRAATCNDGPPDACRGVADADKAKAVCTELFGIICVEINKCSGEDVAACKATLEAQVCSIALGVLPSASDCAAAAGTGCSQGKYTLPPVCKGVVKTSGGTTKSLPGADFLKGLGHEAIPDQRPHQPDRAPALRSALSELWAVEPLRSRRERALRRAREQPEAPRGSTQHLALAPHSRPASALLPRRNPQRRHLSVLQQSPHRQRHRDLHPRQKHIPLRVPDVALRSEERLSGIGRQDERRPSRVARDGAALEARSTSGDAARRPSETGYRESV